MPRPPLKFEQAKFEHGQVLSVVGEVDYSNSSELRAELQTLLDTQPDRLVVDLANVPYMDSSGVATLVATLQTQSRQQGTLVLCSLQPKVMGIFEIAKLTAVFEIATDRDAAMLA